MKEFLETLSISGQALIGIFTAITLIFVLLIIFNNSTAIVGFFKKIFSRKKEK